MASKKRNVNPKETMKSAAKVGAIIAARWGSARELAMSCPWRIFFVLLVNCAFRGTQYKAADSPPLMPRNARVRGESRAAWRLIRRREKKMKIGARKTI